MRQQICTYRSAVFVLRITNLDNNEQNIDYFEVNINYYD